ncbi:MAG: Crp/Fnr family transcriptional regulator, partial [Steroidobacteraceae bacterium]
MGASATPKANQLLAALPESTYRRLLPHLEAVTLTLDQCLFPRAGPLPFAYFPTGCIVTLSYAIEKGAMAKAWPVGREGMVGISLILGNARRSNRA